ncbi:MAG: hypothetical protein KC731_21295 [Myxococcales bacterium]|nr:hypothetical protein [Myxococcales bacterium]
MKPALVAALAASMAAAGCMPTVPAGGLVPPPRPGLGDTGLVVRLPSASGECQRQILGVVRVEGPTRDPGDMLTALRHEAGRLGGDRVVDVEFRRDGELAELSGLAARCSQLFAGRDYVITGRVVVVAPRGEPEQAYAALRDYAAARGTGLVVDVDYERTDGDAFRLTGHVARYVPTGWGIAGTDRPSPRPPPGNPAWRPRPRPASPGVVCPPVTYDKNGRPLPQLDQCQMRF